MQKLKIILFIIVLNTNFTFSQNKMVQLDSLYNWGFYHYLNQNNLHNEAITWLKTYPIVNNDTTLADKINSEIALLFLKLNAVDSANHYFKKCHTYNDSLMLHKALAVSIIMQDTLAFKHFLCIGNKLLSHGKITEYQLIHEILKNESMQDSSFFENLPKDLRRITSTYFNYQKKATLKAALLAVVVPGLGKKYLGFNSQARSALVINSVLLATIAESIIVGSALINIYISVPVFIVFYVGNIWGTVALSKKIETDFKNQIHEELSTYYRAALNTNY
ncbi:MAG: hypothetical protein JEZ09_12230 [Salinivirgaceae bacterium]|nr:hypothetical protein [Salinivirgaceae bacterium]